MILDWIEKYWDALVLMTAEMAPYLLLGFLIAGILHAFVPRTLYSKHLAKPGLKSVVKAAALGIPLPLCSCGVIPTTVGLRREGASRGACTSFLIATPQTGIDSIAATYSLMGLPFAIVRPLAALITAIFGGWLVNKHADKDDATEGNDSSVSERTHVEAEEAGLLQRVKEALDYAFVEMMEDVGKWLVVGLLIAALITVAVPDEWLAALHDYKLLNMLIVLAIAIPMYVCATGSIPIAVSLMAKGLTPGAGLVLLMAGPAVNTASMLVIGKTFGKPTLWLYLLSIIVGAMLFGLGIDYLLPAEWFAVKSGIADAACCDGGISIFSGLCTALLVVLMARALWPRAHHHHHRHEEHAPLTVYNVEGMSCSHCAARVENAIAAVEGVEAVDVSLREGKVCVEGTADSADVVRAVERIGFRASKTGLPPHA